MCNGQYEARAQHLLLTEKGRKLFLSIQSSVFNNLEKSFKELLDDKEYDHFKQALAKICNTDSHHKE